MEDLKLRRSMAACELTRRCPGRPGRSPGTTAQLASRAGLAR
jgi:hypothetical protein